MKVKVLSVEVTNNVVSRCGPNWFTRRVFVLCSFVWLSSILHPACNAIHAQESGRQIVAAEDTAAEDTVSPHVVRLAPSAVSATNPASKQARWYPRPITTLTGTVVSLDDNQLVFQVAGQPIADRYAASRVIDIQWPSASADQQLGMEQFRDGQFGESLTTLISAVSSKTNGKPPPVWRQQWLSMLAAQAAWRSGRIEIALELVQQLDARPMPPMVWALLPIDWTGPVTMNEDGFQIAAKRASSKSLATKLVAASYLLRSPKYRSAAATAIERLAQSNGPAPLKSLAAQLRWRSKTPLQWQRDWRQWEDEIDTLPITLQTAPMCCLAQVAQRAGLADVAKRWRLTLEMVPPTWHPDLSSLE